MNQKGHRTIAKTSVSFETLYEALNLQALDATYIVSVSSDIDKGIVEIHYDTDTAIIPEGYEPPLIHAVKLQKSAKDAILQTLGLGPIDPSLLEYILGVDGYTNNQIENARWELVEEDLIRYNFNGEIELL